MVKFQALVLGAFLFGSLNAQVVPINAHAAIQSHLNIGQGQANGGVNGCLRNVAVCKTAPGEKCNKSGPKCDNIATNDRYDGVLGSANCANGHEHASQGGYNGVHGRDGQSDKARKSQVDNSVKPKGCVSPPRNGEKPSQSCDKNKSKSRERKPSKSRSPKKDSKSKDKPSKSSRKCDKSQEKPSKSLKKCDRPEEKSSKSIKKCDKPNSRSKSRSRSKSSNKCVPPVVCSGNQCKPTSPKKCEQPPKADNNCRPASPQKCVVPPSVPCQGNQCKPSNSPNKCSEKPKGWEKPHPQPNQCSQQPQGQPRPVHQCQRVPRVCSGPQVNGHSPQKCEKSNSKGSRSGSKERRPSQKK